MKALLTLVIVLTITISSFAQDSTSIDNQILAQLGNRAIDGLETLVKQLGISSEKAFPYAVTYVGATYTINFFMSFISFCFGLCVLIPAVTIEFKKVNTDEFTKSTLCVIVGAIFAIVGLIAIYINTPNYLLFQHAPEATTVRYLINLTI